MFVHSFAGNIKLGDFGLAKDKLDSKDKQPHEPPTSGSITSPTLQRSDSAGSFDGDSITTGVGTMLYRAPEQGVEGKSYDQKADMYPLGIILFELFHPPFSTGMERYSTIYALRDKLEFPDAFVKAVPPSVVELIQWLLKPDPTQRPTADQLLQSHYLPPRSEIEMAYLEEAVKVCSGLCLLMLLSMSVWEFCCWLIWIQGNLLLYCVRIDV